MQNGALKSSIVRRLGPTVPPMTIHALFPLFWLFCAIYIMPRFAYAFAQMDAEMPVIFDYSVLIYKHWFLYLFILMLILIADWSIHGSLLRLSHRKAAKLWLIGVVIVEAAISLLLFLPLSNAIMRM